MDNDEMQGQSLQLWGGLECTVNRVRDDYHTQLDRNGHETRRDDIDRFASLNIKAIRYPVLWERHAPESIETADWSWSDERLEALRAVNITPIAGLLHHGSGPRHTSLVDPDFPEKLAEYAGAVAARYPWLEYYTPVNEPLTTARFSGLYGVWYPHGHDDKTFVKALLNQCKGVVLSMREIRKVNPTAKLVQTDDIGKSYGTGEMQYLVRFYNDRRWLTWDLLCGMIDENHVMWNYLTVDGQADPAEILWFKENFCKPDIIGLNFYVTSERWIDHRAELFPESRHGNIGGRTIADIETARALKIPTSGIGPLIMDTWERYGLPIAVTEAHIDANREDQMRWLLEVWDAALQAKVTGADVRAVTVWSLLGAFDWNCLVSACNGYYEPGPLDVRFMRPRPTALAEMMKELGDGKYPTHPIICGTGWWRMEHRFLCEPIETTEANTELIRQECTTDTQPLLITGATGTLGTAFARICRRRNITYKLVSRQEMNLTDPESIMKTLEEYKPWAVINCGGYVRVDDAENDVDACIAANTVGAVLLAGTCHKLGIHCTLFSTDLVFDGRYKEPYGESDVPYPMNVYGKSKRMMEKGVHQLGYSPLIVRTSAFFGPWDSHNFATVMMNRLQAGEEFEALTDVTVTPTYIPELVNVVLDLIVDRSKGIWHLTNFTPVTWYEFAIKVATKAGLDTNLIKPITLDSCGYKAPRPTNSGLNSGHTRNIPLMNDLDKAIDHYLDALDPNDNPIEEFFALDIRTR